VSFWRRGRGDGHGAAEATAVDGLDTDDLETDEATDEGAPSDREPSGSLSVLGLTPRPDGPWDVAERGDLGDYLDLGALRLRGRGGMELRLDLDEATGQITAATVQLGASMVQLQAFAAPRSEGIWDEIREEIATGVAQQGGSVEERAGVFGPELMVRIPVRAADGRTGTQPARFVGIDGPRWFLRAVIHGAAVNEIEAATEVEDLVRDIVVVRGEEAMAPRELLSLALPGEIVDQVTDDGSPLAVDSLDPFERGPEITEVR
jgi:Protein of unknown function (DUF3710)